MKFWHLCSNRWNSAITEYALRCAQALELAGHQNLVSGLEGRALLARANDLGLATNAWPHFKPSLANINRLRGQARQLAPDIVICYGGPETSLAMLLPKAMRIWRFRGQNEDAVRQKSGFWFRSGHRHLAGILAPSEHLAERLRAHLSDRIPVNSVELGLDTRDWSFDEESFRAAQRPTLRIIGRFDPIKGHGPFFLWFRMLRDQWPREESAPFLEVVGQAANIPTEHLHGFARDVGLTEGHDYNIIDQRRDDLAELMASTHLGVVCSQGSEVICRVAEEFLLCGVPLFVSGVGSLEDCLKPSPSFGCSYRALEPKQAIAKLQQMLLAAWRESCEQRRQRAQLAMQHYSLQAMAEKLERSFDLG